MPKCYVKNGPVKLNFSVFQFCPHCQHTVESHTPWWVKFLETGLPGFQTQCSDGTNLYYSLDIQECIWLKDWVSKPGKTVTTNVGPVRISVTL